MAPGSNASDYAQVILGVDVLERAYGIKTFVSDSSVCLLTLRCLCPTRCHATDDKALTLFQFFKAFCPEREMF